VRFDGNNFDYFPENQLTKLENLVQFKRVFMFCLGIGGLGPFVYGTVVTVLLVVKISGAKNKS